MRVVQTLLFVQGINTLVQTLFGTRLPTVIGGSYAFMVPVISIIHDSSLANIENPHTVSVHPILTSALTFFIFIMYWINVLACLVQEFLTISLTLPPTPFLLNLNSAALSFCFFLSQ